MRGLTLIERDALLILAGPEPSITFDPETAYGMQVYAGCQLLERRGCAVMSSVDCPEYRCDCGSEHDAYDITELGRLALRLWPLNAPRIP